MKDTEMSIYKAFAMDTVKENDGVEIPYAEGTNEDGSVPTFVVARAGKSNKKYTKLLEQLTKPHRRSMQLGTMSTETSDKLMLQVFVGSILQGWKNVKDEQGKEIAFNAANATKLMNDLPELYATLDTESKNIELYREEQKEEEAKN